MSMYVVVLLLGSEYVITLLSLLTVRYLTRSNVTYNEHHTLR